MYLCQESYYELCIIPELLAIDKYVIISSSDGKNEPPDNLTLNLLDLRQESKNKTTRNHFKIYIDPEKIYPPIY